MGNAASRFRGAIENDADEEKEEDEDGDNVGDDGEFGTGGLPFAVVE